MALPVRKGYTGNGVQSSLTSSPTDADTTFTVAAKTGWPTTFPFFVVVDPGTSKEEKMRVTGISTLTLTVARGVDNTTAVAHTAGAVIYPVFTASEADEANQVASAMTTKGDLIATDGSTINRLAVGATSAHVLQVDSTATNGFKWGQVIAGGIATDAVTEAKIQDGAVTSAKIAANTIVQGDVATALLKLVCPVGTISAYADSAAPAGWILCNGTAVVAGTHPELYAICATTPDLRGRVPLGKTASGTGSTLLGTGGARKIASGNLPTHAHSLDHDHASFNTTDGGAHTHTISDPGHVHTFSTDNNLATEFAGNAAFGNYNPDVNTNTSSAVTGISVNSTNSAHAHAIDVPAFSGTVTTTFANDDFFEPFVSVNYIIKHDY